MGQLNKMNYNSKWWWKKSEIKSGILTTKTCLEQQAYWLKKWMNKNYETESKVNRTVSQSYVTRCLFPIGLLANAYVNKKCVPMQKKKRLYTFVQMQMLNMYAIMHTGAYKRRIWSLKCCIVMTSRGLGCRPAVMFLLDPEARWCHPLWNAYHTRLRNRRHLGSTVSR